MDIPHILSWATIIWFALKPLQGQVEHKTSNNEFTISEEWMR
jgi:hypothetical protein